MGIDNGFARKTLYICEVKIKLGILKKSSLSL